MCGIIGYIGDDNAVPIIIEGLKKLEYRGYDSAGIAVFGEGGIIDVVKQKGRLTELENRLEETPIQGNMGIGHTRWATHGEPSDTNSHPHLGKDSKIAIVHNGIIENYKQLQTYLEGKGITFASQTDSEVIAQLAEYYYKGDILETVIKVSRRLEGSYALGIMCIDEPETLIAIRKDNPLIIGTSENCQFIASDVPAVLGHTDKVYYPDDNEIVVLKKNSVTFYNQDKELIEKELTTITWSQDSAEKGGYEYFMLKEIMEQPRVIRDTITSIGSNNKDAFDSIDITKFNKIVITACGSAYNAGVVGKYVIEKLARVSVEVELASEFRYKDPIVDDKTLVITVSQSGETADTIAAMREAKAKKATTLSIVNVIGSTIARETDICLFTAAGPEIAVATTKAFSAQLILLYALAIHFAKTRKTFSNEADIVSEINTLPDKVANMLSELDELQKYAATCVGYKSIFFIGRNIDYAIALEGSLKLKEISYIHSEAYAGGELKHGTISLVEENTLVIALVGSRRLYGKTMSNVEQVLSRGAKVLLIGTCEDTLTDDRITNIELPEINDTISPSLSVIILQLLACYIAANKGLDVDKPRNLAKSVTVE